MFGSYRTTTFLGSKVLVPYAKMLVMRNKYNVKRSLLIIKLLSLSVWFIGSVEQNESVIIKH